MRCAHRVLLAGTLLIVGFLTWADRGPADRPAGTLPGLEGTARAVPSELHGRDSVTIRHDTRDALRRAGGPVDDPVPLPREKEFAPPPPGDLRR
jgi:hypothetical protein